MTGGEQHAVAGAGQAHQIVAASSDAGGRTGRADAEQAVVRRGEDVTRSWFSHQVMDLSDAGSERGDGRSQPEARSFCMVAISVACPTVTAVARVFTAGFVVSVRTC